MEHMGRPRLYPDEFRDRAIRLVWEWREARGLNDGGVGEVSRQLGLHRETLRRWVEQSDIDTGQRPGTTSDDKARLGELEREVRELRRANEILKSAALFFGAELDRRSPR
jgi:transposase